MVGEGIKVFKGINAFIIEMMDLENGTVTPSLFIVFHNYIYRTKFFFLSSLQVSTMLAGITFVGFGLTLQNIAKVE